MIALTVSTFFTDLNYPFSVLYFNYIVVPILAYFLTKHTAYALTHKTIHFPVVKTRIQRNMNGFALGMPSFLVLLTFGSVLYHNPDLYLPGILLWPYITITFASTIGTVIYTFKQPYQQSNQKRRHGLWYKLRAFIMEDEGDTL